MAGIGWKHMTSIDTSAVRSDNIRNRHSVRSFTSENVSEEDIEAILTAGLIAPSSKNRQPWRIYTVEAETKTKMVEAMRLRLEDLVENSSQSDVCMDDYRSALNTVRAMTEAPIVIIVCYEDRRPYPGVDNVGWGSDMTDRELVDVLSIGAAVENMALEATERGLGSLWIGDILYTLEQVREMTGIDGNVVAALAVGHPTRELEGRHHRLDGLIVRL